MVSSLDGKRIAPVRRIYHLAVIVVIVSLIIIQFNENLRYTAKVSSINSGSIIPDLIGLKTNLARNMEDIPTILQTNFDSTDGNARPTNREVANDERLNVLLLYADDWRHGKFMIWSIKLTMHQYYSCSHLKRINIVATFYLCFLHYLSC